MSAAPDMSYLCRDWTPTVDDPVVECLMPPCRTVRIELEIVKYQPAAAPTMLLQAADRFSYLWDVTESVGAFGLPGVPVAVVNLDPRHPYRANPGRRFLLGPVTFRLSIIYDPAAGVLNDEQCHTKTNEPWTLMIGCPKQFTGMVAPLGSVITCRWEILNPKGGPT